MQFAQPVLKHKCKMRENDSTELPSFMNIICHSTPTGSDHIIRLGNSKNIMIPIKIEA